MANNKGANIRFQVGLMAGVSLLLLAVAILTVERFHFGESGYPLYVSFQFVDAINPQADVVIGGGVKIGRVTEINVVGDRIHLKMLINNQVKLPRSAKFQILSKGLMGDKYVNVVAEPDAKDFLKPGDLVQGVEPMNIDKAFQRFGQVADSIRSLFGAPDMQTSLGDMVRNFGQLSRRLDQLVQRNEKFVDRGMRDFAGAAGALRDFGQQVQQVTTGLDEALSPDNRANLAASLANIRELSARLDAQVEKIEQGEGTLGVLIHDEGMAKNLQQLVEEVKKSPWKLLWKQ